MSTMSVSAGSMFVHVYEDLNSLANVMYALVIELKTTVTTVMHVICF